MTANANNTKRPAVAIGMTRSPGVIAFHNDGSETMYRAVQATNAVTTHDRLRTNAITNKAAATPVRKATIRNGHTSP